MMLQAHGLPTFVFYLNGEQIARFSGANQRKLVTTAAGAAERAAGLGTFASPELPAAAVLAEFVLAHTPAAEGESADERQRAAEEAAAAAIADNAGKPARLARRLTAQYGAQPPAAGASAAQTRGPVEPAAPAEPAEPATAPGGDTTAGGGPGPAARPDEALVAALAGVPTAALEGVVAARLNAEEPIPAMSGAEYAATARSPESVVVVGGGPAGLAAAIYAARAGLNPVVIAPNGGGQLLGKGVDVENYPGVWGPEGMYTGKGLVQLMRRQCRAFGVRFFDAEVQSVAAGDTNSPHAVKVLPGKAATPHPNLSPIGGALPSVVRVLCTHLCAHHGRVAR